MSRLSRRGLVASVSSSLSSSRLTLPKFSFDGDGLLLRLSGDAVALLPRSVDESNLDDGDGGSLGLAALVIEVALELLLEDDKLLRSGLEEESLLELLLLLCVSEEEAVVVESSAGSESDEERLREGDRGGTLASAKLSTLAVLERLRVGEELTRLRVLPLLESDSATYCRSGRVGLRRSCGDVEPSSSGYSRGGMDGDGLLTRRECATGCGDGELVK